MYTQSCVSCDVENDKFPVHVVYVLLLGDLIELVENSVSFSNLIVHSWWCVSRDTLLHLVV